ncbi:hypothetical protein ABPG75_012958 [Micractinium tetrahymenae]
MASLELRLYLAASAGELEALQACLAAGANPNRRRSNGEVPLHVAAMMGRVACINALLEAGADLEVEDTHGRRPLHDALIWLRSDCVEALLSHGASVEAGIKFGSTPLGLVAEDEEGADCVHALLAAGASASDVDEFGETPVHIAAHSANVEGLRLMLLAQPEAALLRNKKGDVLLALALADPLDARTVEAARCLLELGALPPAVAEHDSC